MTTTYDYNAFGTPTEKNHVNDQGIRSNIYHYAGYIYDYTTSIYYVNARYYMPETGRFMAEDIFRGDGLNRYVYVRNNPLVYVDPTGLCGEGVQEKDKNEYNKAKEQLWKIVYEQYPLAKIRFAKKNYIEDVLNEYKDIINKAGEMYGVPPEVIAGIIVKEQITQSIPDDIALIDTMIRGRQHSTGLGAVFPSTAREAWYHIDVAGAYMLGIYDTDARIELILATHEDISIKTIAVVLSYYAMQRFDTENVSTLTMEQWKQVVGRYNANDYNPAAQKKYSDYVFAYIVPLKKMLK
ncbi:MAG: hypothetical protein GX625_06945 [Clostridiaceae bacterium]|nr:hypothetical protein [Clostridiaceae bacterium]